MIGVIDATQITKIIDQAAASGSPASVDAEDISQVAQYVAAVMAQDMLYRERLIAAIHPIQETLPSGAVLLHMRRNAEAREQFRRDNPSLSSAEVAELGGSRASNKAALANRWKKERRIFSIPVGRTERFPAFQFNESGRPKPALQGVLKSFPKAISGWEVALWFTAANDWLEGRRPLDLIDSDPDAIVDAVRKHSTSLDTF
jgi:hypothetical protein